MDAQLCGDRPTESDKTLYPSDHIGVKVTLRITPRSGNSNSSSAGGGGGGGAAAAAAPGDSAAGTAPAGKE